MKNKIPISRNNRFFSEEDFNLHMEIGEEYLHGDLNMTLVLFRVDRTKTDIDDVYSEVGENKIRFLPPVEFNGLVKIEEPKNSTYKDGLIRYLEPGNLLVHVYIHHLTELNVDIKHGDYIGYPETETMIRLYAVSNDGKITSDNKHNHFGYKPYYRTITCVPTQETEFRGV